MKTIKKLYFIVAPLICITLHSAEKRNTPPTEAEFYGKLFVIG